MALSCCSSYEQCSKAGTCINKNSDLYKEFYSECNYSKVLESGRNFYYKPEKVQEVKIVPEKEIFLYCFNRIFRICRRNKVGLSYIVKPDKVQELEDVFVENDIPYVTEKESFLCVDESGFPEAKSRVWIEVNDEKYNILNYNSLLITEENAKRIARAFEIKGIVAGIELMGIKKQNYEIQNNKNTKNPVPVVKKQLGQVTAKEAMAHIPDKENKEEIKTEIKAEIKTEQKTEQKIKKYVITKDGQETLGLFPKLEIVREIVRGMNEKLKHDKYGYKEVYN
jgi:hypothetical protein